MKKKMAALVLGAMMSFSAMAMAATPEAEVMSSQQQKVAAWTDAMLVKNKPVDTLKLMSKEAQKDIGEKKIAEINKQMSNDLGKYKGGRFLSWASLDVYRMEYLMSFEKEPLVLCVFVFDKNGEMLNFMMQPVQQQPKDSKAGKDDKKDSKKK